ncbi:BTB/POZ domain-containing protein 2 [Nomia melanderi]|uniref:BTB/POZ domain-containing protein 2 n=1 Tax=Nomia melanderi TaxID=2448451 RepID=UPI00130454DD|nr:BTB/POZ domain-containing protein 2-like [Nomia melanderi]
MGLPCDWQINKHKISERGQYLLETGQWSDCKFIVGQEPHQQTLKGHKLFLAMSSPVFEAMFFGGMAEKNDPIPIPDVQPEAFKALLEYIYTDRIDLGSFELACELCYCAKKYMLPSLVENCTKYLWSDLSPKKACRAYEFAKLFEEPVLMEKCLQIICTKTDEVLKESSWEDIELGTLLTVLEQDNLQINSEIELFNAVECWAKAESARKSLDPSNGKSLRAVVGNALLKIRFLSLSPREFAEGPCTSPLLTQDEAFAILINIVASGNKAPMPEGFSTDRHSRGKALPTSVLNSEYLPKDKLLGWYIPHSSGTNVECYKPVYDPYRVLCPREHVLKGPKHYCRRSVLHKTVCFNRNILDCSVTFTVTTGICILGVQVPTQIVSENNVENIWRGMSYNEILYAHLLDSDGTRLTYTHFTTKVDINTLVEILFNRPVYIQKNKIYRVGVVFNTSGSYPRGECSTHEECDSVNFSFGVGNSEDSVRDGLIRSIIFTYH